MFRQPRYFLTNTITAIVAVDQGSLPGDSDHGQGNRPDPRYGGDARVAHERSTLCATTHHDNGSSTTGVLRPLEHSAFQEPIGSHLPQGAHQGASHGPSSRSPRAKDPPVTRCKPNDSINVLKYLERHVGGRATCLWLHAGNYECGYSSQIDLVKRHIKRVHYRLR